MIYLAIVFAFCTFCTIFFVARWWLVRRRALDCEVCISLSFSDAARSSAVTDSETWVAHGTTSQTPAAGEILRFGRGTQCIEMIITSAFQIEAGRDGRKSFRLTCRLFDEDDPMVVHAALGVLKSGKDWTQKA